RHIYWDGGTMLSQLLALAGSAGIEAGLVTRFPDTALDVLVGADGMHEFSVAVVWLGEGTRLEPSGTPATGAGDGAPLEFPLVTAAQAAGRLDAWGEPWPSGLPTLGADHGPTVDEVILNRTSQRRMDRSRGLPRSLLVTSMAAAMRGIDVP